MAVDPEAQAIAVQEHLVKAAKQRRDAQRRLAVVDRKYRQYTSGTRA